MELTPDHHRAAALLGQGWEQKDVAKELNVHVKTVARWAGDPEFEAVRERARRAHLAENPTAQATLKAALGAMTPRGQPDWPTRVRAAAVLVGRRPAGSTPAEAVKQTRIYLRDDDEGSGAHGDPDPS